MIYHRTSIEGFAESLGLSIGYGNGVIRLQILDGVEKFLWFFTRKKYKTVAYSLRPFRYWRTSIPEVAEHLNKAGCTVLLYQPPTILQGRPNEVPLA